jgi:hypothetical protein
MSEQETVQELLARWDAGETIWSIEIGGLGPGYEQAIQVLMVELVRDLKDQPLPTDETFSTWGDATVSRINKDCRGFSGAQVGAAKQIAYKFLKLGPAAALSTVPSDRKILVSNHWPRVQL